MILPFVIQNVAEGISSRSQPARLSLTNLNRGI